MKKSIICLSIIFMFSCNAHCYLLNNLHYESVWLGCQPICDALPDALFGTGKRLATGEEMRALLTHFNFDLSGGTIHDASAFEAFEKVFGLTYVINDWEAVIAGLYAPEPDDPEGVFSRLCISAQDATFLQSGIWSTFQGARSYDISWYKAHETEPIDQYLYEEVWLVREVPEPTTMFLLGTGLAAFAAVGRRRK